MMRVLLLAALCALLANANAERFIRYDAAAVKRFDDELRRLGVVLPSLSIPDEPSNVPDPTVSSAAGDFEGHWKTSQFGRPIAAFEGIPYAQPPVGSLRFKVAQPLTSRLTNYQAKKPGSMCTQRDEFVDNTKIVGSEDCLFVNVYAPETTERKKSELLPVMLWVHGGGFVAGAGDVYQSNLLLDKDVVFVSFNYRLAALGFLTTEDEVIPGNIGFKDQVAALKWVHRNIEAFGGDPNLITIIGESAGGASVEFLMLSPLTEGLIRRVIAMSGSALGPWAIAPPGETRRNVRKAAQHLNCPVEPSKMLLDCLLTKSAEEITAVAWQFPFWGQSFTIPFKPVIEGDIPGAHIPHHPAKLFADGPVNDVPYMTGLTSEEGIFLTAGMFNNETLIRELDENFLHVCPATLMLTKPKDTTPEVITTMRQAYLTPGPLDRSNLPEIANMYTDTWFFWPFLKSIKNHRKVAKASSYFYYFNYQGSRSFGPYPGVCHGDDILSLIIYGAHDFPPPNATDVFMSMAWIDLYTSFARSGVPSSNLIKTQWLPSTIKDIDFEYLHFKAPHDVKMRNNLLPERRALLNHLFGPAQYRDEM